jgi:hypothetical protein
MIWYNIGKGTLSIPSGTNFKFVATQNNFLEINHKENVKTDFSLIKNACVAIEKYANIIIDESPILYMRNIADPQNAISQESVFYNAVKIIAKTDKIEFSTENLEYYDALLQGYRQIVNVNFVKHTTNEINKNREVIYSSKQDKPKFSSLLKQVKAESISNIKDQILKEIRYTYPNFKISNVNFWEDISLFLNCRLKYFNLLKLDKKRKVDFNDLIDLFNLVYVDSNSLYWTEDGSWKEIIIQAGFSDRIYKP